MCNNSKVLSMAAVIGLTLEPLAKLFGRFFRCPNETKFESRNIVVCSISKFTD